MVSKGKRILAAINYWRTFPVYLCVLCSKQRRLIREDVARWNEIDQVPLGFFESLNWHLTFKKEFRNLLQHRLKRPTHGVVALAQFAFARLLWRPLESLYIYTKDIGGGLYIQHGFATIITAEKIGRNCRIYQQVTVGYKDGRCPVLEDNVSVACGAKVLGGITLHANSLVGAGAVVIKDVPECAIVGGVPAKVLGYKDADNLNFQG